MTDDEMQKVAKIMLKAHQECGYCGSDLLKLLNESFPGHEDNIEAVWSVDYLPGGWKK